MVDSFYVQEWIRFAEMDLNSANILSNHYPKPVEIICYHCQQSAEKILKVFLILQENTPPKIHDLLQLLALCVNLESKADEIFNQRNILNRYSTVTHYPAEIKITEYDSKTALRYAKEVLDFFKPYFFEIKNNE
jgi:HEPN domain-containing protein